MGAGLLFAAGHAGCVPRDAPVRAAPIERGERCAACHSEQVAFWLHGGHRGIGCDACHGPPGDHLRETIVPRPRLETRGPEHCMECHLRRRGEREIPPRIDGLAEHLAFLEKKHTMTVDRGRLGDACTPCHNPHLLE